MVHTGPEARKASANQIELDVIKRPGAGGGPKKNLPSSMRSNPGNPGRVIENASQFCYIGQSFALYLNLSRRQGVESRDR